LLWCGVHSDLRAGLYVPFRKIALTHTVTQRFLAAFLPRSPEALRPQAPALKRQSCKKKMQLVGSKRWWLVYTQLGRAVQNWKTRSIRVADASARNPCRSANPTCSFLTTRQSRHSSAHVLAKRKLRVAHGDAVIVPEGNRELLSPWLSSAQYVPRSGIR